MPKVVSVLKLISERSMPTPGAPFVSEVREPVIDGSATRVPVPLSCFNIQEG